MGSYQAKVKYLFIQDPELLDSKTLRNGRLYYQKDSDGSRLRIQFDTFKQEEGPEEKRIEQFFFDGFWLTRIDYSLEKADFYQKARPEKPMDVFEFLSGNFPIIGFTRTENLSKDFEISLVDNKSMDPNEPVHLLLTTKPQSRFREQYKKIDFWMDPKRYLPQRILTASPEGDIYDISFLEPVMNKKIEKAIFTIEIPAHFTQNKHPLDEEAPVSDTIVPEAAKQSR
jgi:outer membrane lipoprotein-sorting protein